MLKQIPARAILTKQFLTLVFCCVGLKVIFSGFCNSSAIEKNGQQNWLDSYLQVRSIELQMSVSQSQHKPIIIGFQMSCFYRPAYFLVAGFTVDFFFGGDMLLSLKLKCEASIWTHFIKTK